MLVTNCSVRLIESRPTCMGSTISYLVHKVLTLPYSPSSRGISTRKKDRKYTVCVVKVLVRLHRYYLTLHTDTISYMILAGVGKEKRKRTTTETPSTLHCIVQRRLYPAIPQPPFHSSSNSPSDWFCSRKACMYVGMYVCTILLTYKQQLRWG